MFYVVPEDSVFNINKYKHMAAIEKIRERYATLKHNDENVRISDINLPSELNEPTKISVPLSHPFVIAPSLLFHSSVFDELDKETIYKDNIYFNRSSEYFDNYIDEEDFHDETEMKVNKIMFQCLQSQDQSKKQQILDQSKIDVSKIQDEFHMNNLEDMISYSIFQLKDAESRKKAANNIVITGGLSRTPFFVEELEDRLIERISKFDPNIERVEVIDYSKREFDNADMIWIGGSILPKLDCMKDSFISRNKWIGVADADEERDRRYRKDCAEFGIKYLKEKISFQW